MTEKMRILVVDDETEIRASLQEIFQEDGYEVLLAGSEASALEEAQKTIDLAIIDIKLGNDNGIEVLRKLKLQFPLVPVIMITGFGSVALAKEAFKLGAHDFLEKPLRLLQVRTSIRNALEGVTLRKQLQQQKKISGETVIYRSSAMKQLYSQASRLASVKEPVVIMGPSGAGKDLLARYLHFEGSRAQGPFIVTNAASLPVTLAEDELFGHERGAFTGADKKREGCFELANGGTLFLDEIGDMDLQVQAKVLRVLESGELMRLGTTVPVKVNVRLICATHKDLEALIAQGKFRHDLWYRISAFVLHVPGLNERKEDIALLAEHFLKKISTDLGVQKQLSSAAVSYLTEADFPGNVRELKHVITRAAVYCDKNTIDLDDIRAHLANGDKTALSVKTHSDSNNVIDFKTARTLFEKEYLQRALEANNGNITSTARAIGMAQSNLSRKLKELGL
jgi:two-component system nitrogen regulation response regulator NtrX